jgi:hypothetical protein
VALHRNPSISKGDPRVAAVAVDRLGRRGERWIGECAHSDRDSFGLSVWKPKDCGAALRAKVEGDWMSAVRPARVAARCAFWLDILTPKEGGDAEGAASAPLAVEAMA